MMNEKTKEERAYDIRRMEEASRFGKELAKFFTLHFSGEKDAVTIMVLLTFMASEVGRLAGHVAGLSGKEAHFGEMVKEMSVEYCNELNKHILKEKKNDRKN